MQSIFTAVSRELIALCEKLILPKISVNLSAAVGKVIFRQENLTNNSRDRDFPCGS